MAATKYIIYLSDTNNCISRKVGKKAEVISMLIHEGLNVPSGFCLSIEAYGDHVNQHSIDRIIKMELERKKSSDTRWEEVWDSSLRIRHAFREFEISQEIISEIEEALGSYSKDTVWAVRSSSPKEDSTSFSFAGLHESVIGVVGKKQVLEAIKAVWASLWSDSSLLYQNELGLRPNESKMAVLIQPVVRDKISGVAFSEDPLGIHDSCAVIEVINGPCSNLVDGSVEPDQWLIDKKTKKVIEHNESTESKETKSNVSLNRKKINELINTLLKMEGLLGEATDMEWSSSEEEITILQARPITTFKHKPDDKRPWYLTLKPNDKKLKQLAVKVEKELIPLLEKEGVELASEDLTLMTNQELIVAIKKRLEIDKKWKRIYYEDFIPFAHGVRRFGVYYNDLVNPEDPYEFIRLLQGQELLAFERNKAIKALSTYIKMHPELKESITAKITKTGEIDLTFFVEKGHIEFKKMFNVFIKESMDIAFNGVRLCEHPETLLKICYNLSNQKNENKINDKANELEEAFISKLGQDSKEFGIDLLKMAKISWKLRDDDNILVGKIESQLLRILEYSLEVIGAPDNVDLDQSLRESSNFIESICHQLNNKNKSDLTSFRFRFSQENNQKKTDNQFKPRQLLGQPASPGLARGEVKVIREIEDLSKFEQGNIIVCDAIQPTMTHIVPLAAAIIERRGGMLIHGSIIARELGIPCVNGVTNLTSLLEDGDFVTVDGYLGIVTVGKTDFSLEFS